MRALALFLIIANLGYLGWATLIDVQDVPVRATNNANDANVRRLVLVSERNSSTRAPTNAASAQGASAANVVPATTAVDNSGSHCISVGPFQDLSSATQASATLKTSGRESRQRLEQGQLWVGYWVTIPNIAKREDAERAVAKLKQNGIDDVYISQTQDASNVVSLGVFKESDRAQRRMSEAKTLGFTPQIAERTRPGSVYWVDVERSTAEPALDFAVLGAQPGKILRLEQRACPASP